MKCLTGLGWTFSLLSGHFCCKASCFFYRLIMQHVLSCCCYWHTLWRSLYGDHSEITLLRSLWGQCSSYRNLFPFLCAIEGSLCCVPLHVWAKTALCATEHTRKHVWATAERSMQAHAARVCRGVVVRMRSAGPCLCWSQGQAELLLVAEVQHGRQTGLVWP